MDFKLLSYYLVNCLTGSAAAGATEVKRESETHICGVTR